MELVELFAGDEFALGALDPIVDCVPWLFFRIVGPLSEGLGLGEFTPPSHCSASILHFGHEQRPPTDRSENQVEVRRNR